MENEVHSTPNTGLRRWTKTGKDDGLKTHDLLCYPWAIVELKHSLVSQAEVKVCYYQAANASAAALSLQENLSSWLLVLFRKSCHRSLLSPASAPESRSG